MFYISLTSLAHVQHAVECPQSFCLQTSNPCSRLSRLLLPQLHLLPQLIRMRWRPWDAFTPSRWPWTPDVPHLLQIHLTQRDERLWWTCTCAFGSSGGIPTGSPGGVGENGGSAGRCFGGGGTTTALAFDGGGLQGRYVTTNCFKHVICTIVCVHVSGS